MTEQPLGEPAFLVLTALADGAQHGYGLIEEVRRVSDGAVTMRTGTLYAILDRLRGQGLVEVEREEVVQSRLRRYYRLTGLGVARLTAETERLRRQTRVAGNRLRRLGAQPGTGVA
jgi:DNA-binding PadR family transcriptional regulator